VADNGQFEQSDEGRELPSAIRRRTSSTRRWSKVRSWRRPAGDADLRIGGDGSNLAIGAAGW